MIGLYGGQHKNPAPANTLAGAELLVPTYHVISAFNIEKFELSANVVSFLLLVDKCAPVFS